MTLKKKLDKIEQRLKVLEPNMPNFLNRDVINDFKEAQIRVRLIDKVSIWFSDLGVLLWDENIDSFYDIGSDLKWKLSKVILELQRGNPAYYISLDGSIKA